MHRFLFAVALAWSTPALAYPYLIDEVRSQDLTEIETQAICHPHPTIGACTHDYVPVRIQVSATEYCFYANSCMAGTSGFSPLPPDELVGLRADFETLMTDLGDCEDDVDALATTVETRDGEVAALTALLATCETLAADAAADLADVQATVTIQDGEIITLEIQVDTLETENAALEAENTALESDNAALVSDNAALVSDNAALVSDNAACETENTSLEAQIAELEDQDWYYAGGQCGCSTTGGGGLPGMALLGALGLVRRRRTV